MRVIEKVGGNSLQSLVLERRGKRKDLVQGHSVTSRTKRGLSFTMLWGTSAFMDTPTFIGF